MNRLLFADGLALLAYTQQGLQNALERFLLHSTMQEWHYR